MVKTIYNNIFKVRVNDDDEKGGCTFVGGAWKDVSTDDLFKDELFKFQTEIGVDVEPLEYVDLNAPAENFFEDPILGRSYNF